jgi:hypothetical protein
MDRQQSSSTSKREISAESPRVIVRRCPVCEWQGEVIDKGEPDVDCPQCHAPTDVITQVEGKNPHAAALGRLGGLRGGPARAAALSAKRRHDIARKAALARWRNPR